MSAIQLQMEEVMVEVNVKHILNLNSGQPNPNFDCLTI